MELDLEGEHADRAYALLASLVKPPRIAGAPASLECSTLQIGDNRFIIGLMKHLHIHDEIFDPATLRVRSEHSTSSVAWPARTGIAARAIASR